jgi:hypothetical protein
MTYFVVDPKKLTWKEVSESSIREVMQQNKDLILFNTQLEALECLKTIALGLLPQINSILNEVEPTVSIKMNVKLPLNISQSIVRTFIEEDMTSLSDRLGTEVSFKINFI